MFFAYTLIECVRVFIPERIFAMSKTIDNRILRCSFCGKMQDEVGRMIAGPGVCICDECIELCQSVLDGEDPYESQRPNRQQPKQRHAAGFLSSFYRSQNRRLRDRDFKSA